MVLNVHRNHKVYLGWGGRGYGGGGRGKVYTYRYTVTTRMTCIKIGSDESHFTVSLIVRDKVIRPCPQITIRMWFRINLYSKLVHSFMVYTKHAPRRQQFRVAPATLQPSIPTSTPLLWVGSSPSPKQLQ